MNWSLLMRFFFCFLLLVFALNPAESQIIKTRLDFVGGLGYPEFLHAGIRYQYGERSQAGMYYGGDMDFKPEIIRSFSVEHLYHFGKNNFYSNRPVWFTRQGYTYSTHTDEAYIYRHSYLTASLGYDIPFNNRVGMALDMGMNIKVYETQEYKDSGVRLNPDPRWYTGFLARIQLYVSL